MNASGEPCVCGCGRHRHGRFFSLPVGATPSGAVVGSESGVHVVVGALVHPQCAVPGETRVAIPTQTVITALRKLTRKSGIRVLVS
jgi:hypothetical protein